MSQTNFNINRLIDNNVFNFIVTIQLKRSIEKIFYMSNVYMFSLVVILYRYIIYGAKQYKRIDTYSMFLTNKYSNLIINLFLSHLVSFVAIVFVAIKTII